MANERTDNVICTESAAKSTCNLANIGRRRLGVSTTREFIASHAYTSSV